MKLPKLFLLSMMTLATTTLLSCNDKTANNPNNEEPEGPGIEGSKDNPIMISTADDLDYLAYEVNDASDVKTNVYFKLANDIDLGCDANNQWTPIGLSNKFDGNFDGNGFTISGLYIDKGTEGSTAALFGQTDVRAIIKNLTVEGFVKGNHLIAGIVGKNFGTIINCSNMCEVVANGYSGGVAGETRENSNLNNCHNGGRITANGGMIGGVTGCSYQTTAISNCYNTGEIESTSSTVAGVVGYNTSATITNSFNYGTITGPGAGIAAGQGTSSTITNCYSLEGSFEPSANNTHEVTKTAEEMKDAAFVTTLNASQESTPWTAGTEHPVLSWQK